MVDNTIKGVSDLRKKQLRMERINKQTVRIIKDDIARDKRCCLDKGDIPSFFIRCVDCPKPLDTSGEIC